MTGTRLRDALLSVGLFSLIFPLNACSQGPDESRATRRAISQSQAIASDFLDTELALSPETASRLNLERRLGPNASFALDNHSQSGFERRRLVRIELLQRLQTRPRLSEDHVLTRDLYIAERALVDLISLEQIGFGRFNYTALNPYAIDPYSGIWIEGPTLLAFRQSITNREQALAYLARLRALSASIEDTKRRLIADSASGIILSKALATETRNRITRLLDDDVNGLDRLNETFNALIESVDDLEESERTQLSNLVRFEVAQKLRPAYQDLAAVLAGANGETNGQLGIWAQPHGHDLFSGILAASLGESVDLERLHQSHIDAVARQSALMDDRLSLPDEIEPTSPVPTRLLTRLNWFANEMGRPEASDVPASTPETLLALAPKSAWTRISEGTDFPPHVSAVGQFTAMFGANPYLAWQTESPAYRAPHRQILEYSAITAAWQSYVWAQSEHDPDSIDPFVGTAASHAITLIQTVLSAADTGIHLQRWDLAEATDYIATQAGLSEPLSRQLALSIAARPGYHSAIAVAWQRIDGLAERARAVLGERYSEIDFQRTLIEPGPRPLSLVERDIEAWYGKRLSEQVN